MTGEELIFATEKARQKDGAGALLGCMPRCIVRVVDPGPYAFMKAGDTAVADWQKMLVGDGLMGLAFMRELSVPNGDTIEDARPHKCQECGSTNNANYEVAKLATKPLPAASAARFASGDPWFTATFGDDTICYELPRVADSIALPGLMAEINRRLKGEGKPPRLEPTGVESAALSLRAVNGATITDPMKRWDFVRKWNTKHIFALLMLQDEQTCGIDLATEITCPCGAVIAADVPLGATVGIFSPGKPRPAGSSGSSSRGTSSSASTPSSGAPTAPATSPTPAKRSAG